MNVILIPAYQPDEKLDRLVDELIALKSGPIVVVDDGSDPSCAPVFSAVAASGCIVLRHPLNQGKGAAIKTGIRYAADHFPDASGYVTCDADGQHRPSDILRVGQSLDAHPDALVLGSRDFSGPDVPRNSRLGNRFSSWFFKLSTGLVCGDTQTGLRGIPKNLTDAALSLSENRYDYEMTFLLTTAKAGVMLLLVPIETVYLDQNASSHFRPFVDSVRIYRQPIRFLLASILSTIVDLLLFDLFTHLLEGPVVRIIVIATVVARVVSGVLNFLLNRHWSFRNPGSIRRQFLRYFALYLAQLLLSAAFVALLSFLPVSHTLVKALIDGTLFFGSYFVQKRWVFKRPAMKRD
ncbi:MAG TPA: family 2 glycosyl transferase [Acholeplasmatales bacterium]|nr:MAG: hypothetical protein A2Y16_06175 [Tenericutes bacterium GWF2_57_13]HAQ56920.1 family 2 glycosyl transferase [Acholeplasmatales bacterium]